MLMILNLDLKPATHISTGDTVLCPGFFGDYFKLKMGSETIGESEGGMVVQIKYDDDTKTYRPNVYLDSRRILNCSF